MDFWELTEHRAEPQHPVVLQSVDEVARLVLIALRAGEDLEEHQVHEHMWLQVLEGSVQLAEHDGPSRDAGPGDLAHWEPAERHSVTATEEALLLLFLAPWPGPGHPRRRLAAEQD
jgi:quercetin dioxygenase-like cupin family protein